MEEILFISLKSFYEIFQGVFKSFSDDIFFPKAQKSYKEKLLIRIKRLRSIILNQQDKISYQAGSLQGKDRQICDLKNLLIQKDKEIMVLRDRIRSLQIKLP